MKEFPRTKLLDRGCSSSGSTSDCGSRSPQFNSRIEQGILLFSSLSYISLNQWCVLNQVPDGRAAHLVFNLSIKNGGFAVQLEAKEA